MEFGAGAALPSLVLFKEGTKQVICTDGKANDETFEALELSFLKNSQQWGIDKEELKEKIIELIEQDIEDGEVLPHYGLIADWKIRYMDLAKLIWQYLHV